MVPVIKRCPHTDSSGCLVNHATNSFHLSFFRIKRPVRQFQFHQRHFFQHLFRRAVLTNQVQQLFFRHRKIDIHLRYIRHNGQRSSRGGTNQCPYPKRKRTNYPVRRTGYFRIRQIFFRVHQLCLRLRQSSLLGSQRIFRHLQIILTDNSFLC